MNSSHGGWMVSTVQVAIQGIEYVDDHRTNHPHPALRATIQYNFVLIIKLDRTQNDTISVNG